MTGEAKTGDMAKEPDWTREAPRRFWDPGRKLIKTLRDYDRLSGRGGPVVRIRRSCIVLRHRFWSAVTSCDIPLNCNIAGGFLMPHPSGVVIHPGAVIGPNCMMMHQTTLGTARGDQEAPTLGGHVDVSAGAKILGAITIGDHAVIGANAVVLKDVAPFAVAAGVPAKTIGENRDRAAE